LNIAYVELYNLNNLKSVLPEAMGAMIRIRIYEDKLSIRNEGKARLIFSSKSSQIKSLGTASPVPCVEDGQPEGLQTILLQAVER
jgi:hypothetical protein